MYQRSMDDDIHKLLRKKIPRNEARFFWVDAGGTPTNNSSNQSEYPLQAALYREMIQQGLHWGEPHFRLPDNGPMCLAFPLTHNQNITGGLIIEFTTAFMEREDAPGRMNDLANDVMTALVSANLVNAPLLRENAARAARERIQAEAIHSLKSGDLQKLRNFYWNVEPELFLAMRRGERREARRLLNQVLMGVYSFGQEELHRVKGYILHFASMLMRTMTACGIEPAKVLGANFDLLHELQNIESDEALSAWITDFLERLMENFEIAPEPSRDFRIQLALNYMREHLDEPLSRNDIAARIGTSPTHFSRLFHNSMRHSFPQYLNRLRCEKAAGLLAQTNRDLLQIAVECGFQDQSYFSKVFKKQFGQPPAQFRESHNITK